MASITCPSYLAEPSSTRCVSYLDNGACKRPDHLMCVEWLARNEPKQATFKNTHLSYSRLQLYEACPRAFKHRYVDQRKDARPAPQLAFGKLVHEVLEAVAKHHLSEELSGPFEVDLALRLYQQGWRASFLCGSELFEDGQRQLRQTIRERGPVDHWDILGIEQRFELSAGPYSVIGAIDLVERSGDDLLVIDYKTGMLPMPWDVDGTLQLTLYDIAARQLWPWAKNVRLQLHQLRQGLQLETSRTDDQRSAALAYVEAMGARTESDTDWEATPGRQCSICAWRGSCTAYSEMLEAEPVAGADLDGIAREHREIVARQAALKTRLRDVETALRAKLEDVEEFTAGGARWSLYPVEGLSYSPVKVGAVLDRAGIEADVMSVDKAKLWRVLGKVEDTARRKMIKLELEATATKRIYPRLWCKG